MLSQKLIARYAELKQQAPDCLLLMQVGAFMKVLDDDARSVSKVTGLKLQMSGDVDAPVVVGGFPKTGLDGYIGKLVRAGHSLAVALQDEDMERTLGEVIRVATGSAAGVPGFATRSPEPGDTVPTRPGAATAAPRPPQEQPRDGTL